MDYSHQLTMKKSAQLRKITFNNTYLRILNKNFWFTLNIHGIEIIYARDIHPFNVLNPSKVFMTLVESARGPQIITVNENIVGVQFDLDAKYPET